MNKMNELDVDYIQVMFDALLYSIHQAWTSDIGVIIDLNTDQDAINQLRTMVKTVMQLSDASGLLLDSRWYEEDEWEHIQEFIK